MRRQQVELEAETALLREDVTRLREHLGSVSKGESGSAQDQLVKRILEREEQLRALKARAHGLLLELERKEQALATLFASAQKTP